MKYGYVLFELLYIIVTTHPLFQNSNCDINSIRFQRRGLTNFLKNESEKIKKSGGNNLL